MPDHPLHLPFNTPAPKTALRMLGLAVLLLFSGSAQNIPRGGALPQPIGQPVTGSLDDGLGNHDPLTDERQLRYLNAERQKSMVSDANKLLRLAMELDSEIGRQNHASLTPDQLRKIAEIEKLAHNVKEKMSTSVRATPAFQQLGPPFR